MDDFLSDEELDAIESRCTAASPGPWKSFVEGRDHIAGDDFIQIQGADDAPDLYVQYASRTVMGLTPASTADQDFIAAARQDVPRLLEEVRRLRNALHD